MFEQRDGKKPWMIMYLHDLKIRDKTTLDFG